MAEVNAEKADLLYGVIDNSAFYQGAAFVGDRSHMNVTFTLPNDELTKKFLDEALEKWSLRTKRSPTGGWCSEASI